MNTGIFSVFKEVLKKLEESKIDYMVVGSVASMAYGESRLTKDLDIVIQVASLNINSFLSVFPEETYYCPPPEVLSSEFSERGQFNILHLDSGVKIDFMIQKRNAHSVEEFSRRSKVELWENFHVFIATPEDIIIKKLLYYKEGLSEKHLRDIRGIISQTELDQQYLKNWILRLNLEAEWSLV